MESKYELFQTKQILQGLTLCKMPEFHLTFWCGNFLETHRKYAFSQNFHTNKLGEIMIFYAVWHKCIG